MQQHTCSQAVMCTARRWTGLSGVQSCSMLVSHRLGMVWLTSSVHVYILLAGSGRRLKGDVGMLWPPGRRRARLWLDPEPDSMTSTNLQGCRSQDALLRQKWSAYPCNANREAC